MTSKEKPLAGAVQARQQGASNIYLQDTHFGPSGQGQQSSRNSAALSPVNAFRLAETGAKIDPDYQHAEAFLTLLDEEAEGFTFQTFDDNEDRKDKRLTRVLNGSFDECKKALTALNKKGAGVFVTINETDLKGRKKANIKRVRAVFQEDDEGGKALPVEPHITVNTSPEHFHRYILTDSLNKAGFEQIMETMVADYGSCSGAKDLSRVLRLPGYYHKKDPDNPFMVRVVQQSNEPPLSGTEVKKLFPSVKDDFVEFCKQQDPTDIQPLIKQILSGEVYHPALLKLSAHYIGSGNSGTSTRATLNALMEQAAVKDKRWQARYQQIPDLVKSAIKKYRSKSLQLENLSPINVISCADLLTKEFPPRKNLMNPWLPVQGLTMIHAYRGVGKTHLSMGIACAVATGSKFLQWSADEPAGVLFIDGEMPAVVLQERVAQSITMMDGTGEAPFNIITPDLQGDNGMPDLASLEGQSRLEPYLTDEIKLIVVDNISTLCRSSQENKGDSWVPVQEWALRMRARGKSVLLIHHEGKGGQQRGTSRREDILDTVIQLKWPADYTPNQGATFEVHFLKSRGIFGDDVKPFEAQLIDMGVGNATWTTKSIEDSLLLKVERLLQDGYQQKDIADELNISKGYVSKLVRQIKANG